MDRATLVTRSERAIVEDVGGETVVLDLDADSFLRLNAAGAVLWGALDQPAPLEALAKRLEQEFGIDSPTALADTTTFVQDMSARGLLSCG